MSDRFLKMSDVAALLDLNPKTVHELYRSGRLPDPERVMLITVRQRERPLWRETQIIEWAKATGRLVPRGVNGALVIQKARPGRRRSA